MTAQTGWSRTSGENRDTGDIDFLAQNEMGARQQLLYGAGARVSDGRFDEVVSGLVFFPFHQTDYLISGVSGRRHQSGE